MLTYCLPLAFTKMQPGLELNYSICLKMCCFRDSYVKCLSSGFCLDFIFSFSRFFIALSSTWKKDVWSKRDIGPTGLGQWHLCAHILNPHRCRCEGWTVGKNYFRKELPLSWDWLSISNISLSNSTGCLWKPESCAAKCEWCYLYLACGNKTHETDMPKNLKTFRP